MKSKLVALPRILFIAVLLFTIAGIIPVDVQETKAAITVTSLGTATDKTGSDIIFNLTSGVSSGDVYIVCRSFDHDGTYVNTDMYYSAVDTDAFVIDVAANNSGDPYGDIMRYTAIQDKSWDGTYPYIQVDGSAAGDAQCITVYKVTGIDYGVTVPDQTSSNINRDLNGTYTRVGERIIFTACTITSVEFKISKVGSPTGTAYVRVRDASTDSIIGTIGSIDISTLDGTPTWTTFTGGSAVISSTTDARIGIEYTDGDSSNHVDIDYYNAGSRTDVGVYSDYYPGTWNDTSSYELAWQNMTGAKYLSSLDATNYNTGSGTDASTNSSGILSQDDEIVFACTAVEDEVDDGHGTWTTGTGYASGNEQFDATNGAGDASNIQVHSVARIVTDGTSQAYQGVDAGHDSIDWAACIATYKMASAGTPSLTNTPSPSSKDFGTVSEQTTYYCKGTAPNNPVVDGDCTWTITNDGSIAIDVNIKGSNFTGGSGWTLTSGTPGSDEAKITAYYSGQNPASGTVLTTSDQLFYNSLAASGTIKWDFSLLTGTYTDNATKTATITLTAVTDS